MYGSMRHRSQYPAVIISAGAVVTVVYVVIMFAGYYFYAQYSQAPGELCVKEKTIYTILTIA
jgi:hypothetical protein